MSSTTHSGIANPSSDTSWKVEGTGILNLTQHVATTAQAEEGVYEPKDKAAVQQLLTFEEMPTATTVVARAKALARVASDHGAKYAMVGGAPYLMGPLERELHAQGITPLYAFSVRTSTDQAMPDGSVRKVALFCHRGFIEAMHPVMYGWESIEA